MRKLKWLVGLFAVGLLAGSALAQGVRFDSNITTAAKNVAPGTQAPIYSMPGALITVCGYPAEPSGAVCTNTVTAYSDKALTQALTQPFAADSTGAFGFWIAPGTYSYSVQNALGAYLGTYSLSVNVGADLAIRTSPPASQTVTQPAGTTLSINALNNQVYVPNSGDAGAAIATAFAQFAGTEGAPAVSAVVNLYPGQVYNATTSVEIPNTAAAPYITSATLDCHGSTIAFGSGFNSDGVIVHGENANGPGQTGSLRNCYIVHPSSTGAAIHNKGRLGFTFEYLNILASGVGIDNENTNTDGGPGYNETNVFQHITIGGSAQALHAGMYWHRGSGGTDSFAYNYVADVKCELYPNAYNTDCLLAGDGVNPVTLYGGTYFLKMNSNGNTAPYGATLVHLNGAAMYRGAALLTGETTSGNGGFTRAIWAQNQSNYHMTGTVFGGDSYVDPGSQYNTITALSGEAPINDDFAAGTVGTRFKQEAPSGGAPIRYSYFEAFGSQRHSLLAGEPCVGVDQISERDTDTNNPDVGIQGTGNPHTNIMFTTHQFGGVAAVGFGPGYGCGPTGTNVPKYNVEANSIAVRQPGYGGSGTPVDTLKALYFDKANNRFVTAYQGSIAAGQPSFPDVELWYDSTTYTSIQGRSCYASGGVVHCTFNGPVGLGTGSTVNNSTICTPGNGACNVLTASLTTTAATSDTVTVTGMTSSGHCSLTPTGSTAAADTSRYVSAKATNSVTVTHAATAGETFDLICTPY